MKIYDNKPEGSQLIKLSIMLTIITMIIMGECVVFYNFVYTIYKNIDETNRTFGNLKHDVIMLLLLGITFYVINTILRAVSTLSVNKLNSKLFRVIFKVINTVFNTAFILLILLDSLYFIVGSKKIAGELLFWAACIAVGIIVFYRCIVADLECYDYKTTNKETKARTEDRVEGEHREGD